MAAAAAPLVLCGAQPVCVAMAAGILAMLDMQARGVSLSDSASVASDAVSALLSDAPSSTLASVRAAISNAAALATTAPQLWSDQLLDHTAMEEATQGTSISSPLSSMPSSTLSSTPSRIDRPRNLYAAAAEKVAEFRDDLEAVLRRDAAPRYTVERTPSVGGGDAGSRRRTPPVLAFSCPGLQGGYASSAGGSSVTGSSVTGSSVTERSVTGSSVTGSSVTGPMLVGKGLPMEKMKELWERAKAYPLGTEYRRTYLEKIDQVVLTQFALLLHHTLSHSSHPIFPISSSPWFPQFHEQLVKDACALTSFGAPVRPPAPAGPRPPPVPPIPPPPPAPYTEMPVYRPWWIPRWFTGLTHGGVLFLGGISGAGAALVKLLFPARGARVRVS